MMRALVEICDPSKMRQDRLRFELPSRLATSGYVQVQSEVISQHSDSQVSRHEPEQSPATSIAASREIVAHVCSVWDTSAKMGRGILFRRCTGLSNGAVRACRTCRRQIRIRPGSSNSQCRLIYQDRRRCLRPPCRRCQRL
jgi:hypothetical protein